MQKILRTLSISLFLLSFSINNSYAQCNGNCGTPTVGNCGCDTDCWLYGDCCPDIQSACPDIRPTEAIYPPTFPGGNGTVEPLACNPAASICTPGVSANFNFDQNTPGPPQDFANPTGCSTGLFGNPNGFGFIILNITGSGPLNLLVNGSANNGFIDVVVYNIPPGVAPCVAVMSSANEIGCNYATAAVGCTQFGNTLGCASSLPAPFVQAGQQLMVIVHDYSSASNSFNLQLGPNGATTGPPNATINTPGAVCATSNPITLTAVSNGGTWSGPGMSSSGVFNPAAAGVGTHTINYAVGNAPCNASSTSQITVGTPPTTSFTSNSPICVGQTIVLAAAAGPAGATYHWSGPGGWTSTGANTTRPNATAAMSGTYSHYIVSGGCTSTTVTQTVTVNPTAPAPIINSNSPVCYGNPMMFDGPSDNGLQYFWSGPNGWSDNTENPVVGTSDYNMSGDYSLYVVGANGCTSAVAMTPMVINVPPKPIIQDIAPQCFGAAASNLYVDQPGGTWTGTAVSPTGTFDPSVAGSGTHQIIYTIEMPCGSADTTEIIVSYPMDISGEVKDETCADVGDGGIDISTSAYPGSQLTYLWSNGTTTEDIDSVTYGNYSVVVTDQYGCAYNRSFTVSAGNSLNFTYNVNHVLCYGTNTGSIQINPMSGTPPYSYTVNGAQSSSSPISNLYANVYNVSIRDSRGCDTSFTTQITQPPVMIADSTNHQVRLGDYLTFNPAASGGTGDLNLSWHPNYNISCTDCLTPMAWPEINTNYTLTITDENGCVTQSKVIVEVYHDGPFIPNSFTPGRDELNNEWKISDYGVKDFEVLVFDRWGSKVFESDDIYQGWDGKLKNGNLMESSVYVYKIHIKYLDGKEKTLLGNITLLR